MNVTKNYRLALAGLLVAVGLLLPYLTAHLFGLPGTVLLPMHIPVLLIGLFCGPGLGALCGLAIPVLSSLLTGMPAAFPMLPIMAGELCTYGFLSGLLHQKTGRVYLSLIPAMAAGRAVYGLIFAILLMANEGPLRALSVSAAFLQGLPGIAIQLTLIPFLVKAVLGRQHPLGEETAPSGLEEAKARILRGEATCIVMQKGKIVAQRSGIGVNPLLYFLEEKPELLRDAQVADKVIGKAAAMLLVLGGASCVYGELMSVSGRAYLERHGVTARNGRCIDVISSRSGNGICPLEQSVLELQDPEEGLLRLKETVARLMEAM